MESDFTTKKLFQKEILLKAYNQMMLAKSMADVYEENRNICKYVHSTSRGHEAIQLATAYQLSKKIGYLLITETDLYYWEWLHSLSINASIISKSRRPIFWRSFLLFASIQ